MPSVFISYSHDSDAHRDFVRGIADRLCHDGVDCRIDQYINGFPPEGWQRWMEGQIEAADFVLLVCTETYLRRFRGHETHGGNGVNLEGVIISQSLYENYSQNTKFIPTIPDNGDFAHVPMPLKPYTTYCLNSQYEDVYRIITRQAKYQQPRITPIPDQQAESPNRIYSDDLPTVEGKLFGRKDELAVLNQAFNDTDTSILQFVASGGTGKTKLIRTWLDENTDQIDSLIAWSFYSQGSSEDKQISSTPFFIQALKSLGSDKDIFGFNTEEEKGEHIADLLRERHCLLVLDGLEPLQQVGRGMRGELKDRAIRKLLRCLVGNHNSLCIITTRLPVHELKDRRRVVQHDLQNLAPEDGVALLRSFTKPYPVHGHDVDMYAAVEEYGRHALALHLLGNALATYLDGDVRKRDKLGELIGDYNDVERHAFKVMQAYEHWLEGTVELKLLYLLGLFDHPVEQDVLAVLWEAEITGLTAGVDKKAWLVAQQDLISKYQMMSAHEGKRELFDCHPLIREYFGKQLKNKWSEIWLGAHISLHQHYIGQCDTSSDPKNLHEMKPFIKAIMHACLSKNYRIAFILYWDFISKRNRYYLNEISAFSEDLEIIKHFFNELWTKTHKELRNSDKVILTRIASHRLKSLGLITPSLLAIETITKIEKIDYAVNEFLISVRTQTDLLLSLGKIKEAIIHTDNTFRRIEKNYTTFPHSQRGKIKNEWLGLLTIRARCHHQSGNLAMAKKLFNEVHSLLLSPEFSEKSLYGLPGFRYCDFLLCLDEKDEALRVAKNIRRVEHGYKGRKNPLYLGLSSLVVGIIKNNKYKIEHATKNLRESEHKDHLPRGLITSAGFYSNLNEMNLAFGLLREAYEIIEPSFMRLHLTDYHLEMARLILAVETAPTQYPEATPNRQQRTLPFAGQEEPGILTLESHIAEADKLIQKTGYHRRDAELAELKQAIGEH